MDEEKGRTGQGMKQISSFLFFCNYLGEHADNSLARNAELLLCLCSVYWEMCINEYTDIRITEPNNWASRK